VDLGNAPVGQTGQWSFDDAKEALADGAYSFTAFALDVVGQASLPSNSLSVLVDGTPPPVPQVLGISPDTGLPGDAVTSARNLTLTGTAEPGTTVAVSRDGHTLGTVPAGSDGQWSFDDTQETLADGRYDFTAFATDRAGNDSPSAPP